MIRLILLLGPKIFAFELLFLGDPRAQAGRSSRRRHGRHVLAAADGETRPHSRKAIRSTARYKQKKPSRKRGLFSLLIGELLIGEEKPVRQDESVPL
jgi:hypothetical protein